MLEICLMIKEIIYSVEFGGGRKRGRPRVSYVEALQQLQ